MFKKLFERYARAIANERDRESFYKLFCACIATLIASLVLTAALLVCVFIFGSESEPTNIFVAIILLVLLLLWLSAIVATFILLILLGFNYKKALSRAPSMGEPAETAKLRRQMSDPAGYLYTYFFPDEALRAEADGIRKSNTKTYATVSAISGILAIIAAIFFISADINGNSLEWYAMPVAITLLFAIVLPFSLLLTRRLKDVEIRQKIQLENNPAYAKNLELFTLYTDFYKFKGKIYLIFVAVGIVASWVLAVLFPSLLWSVLPLLIIIVGLVINILLVRGLRAKAEPIEREIDKQYAARTAEQTATVQSGAKDTANAEITGGTEITSFVESADGTNQSTDGGHTAELGAKQGGGEGNEEENI